MKIISTERIGEGVEVITNKGIYRIVYAWTESKNGPLGHIVRDGWDLLVGSKDITGYIHWQWGNRFNRQKDALGALKEWKS